VLQQDTTSAPQGHHPRARQWHQAGQQSAAGITAPAQLL